MFACIAAGLLVYLGIGLYLWYRAMTRDERVEDLFSAFLYLWPILEVIKLADTLK